MRIWIIGAGGLFGSSLARVAASDGHHVTSSHRVPWGEPEQALEHLLYEAHNFMTGNSQDPTTWAIAWAAGHVTTASSSESAAQELDLFTGFIAGLTSVINELDAPVRGRFLLASSAGGIYGGASNPPFGADTPPCPVGPYGKLKFAQEEVARERLSGCIDVTVARLANLYGPGQDLAKLQGLISRLALSAVTREPLTMFVPLDTLRDYIYVDDAARLTLHWLTADSSLSQIRVIASGQPTSLGQLISLMQDIAHSRIPVAYGLHPSAALQSPDLRLVSDHDQATQSWTPMPLPAGMKLVYQDILARTQQGAHSIPVPID